MNQILSSVSFTKHVKDWLKSSNQPTILHIFDDVCNLINERKEIISIVSSEIGNGPFSVVIEDNVLFSRHLHSDSKVLIQEDHLLIGDLNLSFAYAQEWNPKPNWEALLININEITNRFSLLQIDIENETISQFAYPLSSAVIVNDITAIKDITKKLAGLGSGLTPAGDDFLMGVMHATWMIHPQDTAKIITSEIAKVATPLTTSLSGAWLQSAANGEAGELWHDFFEALINDENMYLPMSKIFSVGETSGSDALSGFLRVMNEYDLYTYL